MDFAGVTAGLRNLIKRLLRYRPLPETAAVRAAIDAVRASGLPYCPPDEGDLLFSLVRANGFADCLETGFLTGSSALYLCAAVAPGEGRVTGAPGDGRVTKAPGGGRVTSVSLDDDAAAESGRALLRAGGHDGRHRLVRANANRALPELFLAGERFDLIFVDGWKTFDHLAFEAYLFNQLLRRGGVIVFDDSHMPSVRKTIRLLRRFYAYEEIAGRAHGETRRLRLFQVLTRRSLHRPYRALRKTRETADQPAFADWNFHRRL